MSSDGRAVVEEQWWESSGGGAMVGEQWWGSSGEEQWWEAVVRISGEPLCECRLEIMVFPFSNREYIGEVNPGKLLHIPRMGLSD